MLIGDDRDRVRRHRRQSEGCRPATPSAARFRRSRSARWPGEIEPGAALEHRRQDRDCDPRSSDRSTSTARARGSCEGRRAPRRPAWPAATASRASEVSTCERGDLHQEAEDADGDERRDARGGGRPHAVSPRSTAGAAMQMRLVPRRRRRLRQRLLQVQRARIPDRGDDEHADQPGGGDRAADVEQQRAVAGDRRPTGCRATKHGADREQDAQLGRADAGERQPEDADRMRREEGFGGDEEVGGERARARSSASSAPTRPCRPRARPCPPGR